MIVSCNCRKKIGKVGKFIFFFFGGGGLFFSKNVCFMLSGSWKGIKNMRVVIF